MDMAGTEKKMTGPKVSEFGIRRPAERNTGQCRLEKCHWQRGNQEEKEIKQLELLELELIQTQMAQKPMLRAEVGMRVRCANKASAE